VRRVILASSCTIGAKCSLTTSEVLPEITVIFSTDYQRVRCLIDQLYVIVLLFVR
jgi:hypothetical protein